MISSIRGYKGREGLNKKQWAPEREIKKIEVSA